MPRFVAFLRAINVGGHTVSMAELRRLVEGLGFSEVETFIASGNVIFASRATPLATLERRIGDRLRRALGYEVVTFVRTDAEVAAIAGYSLFRPALLKEAVALNVGFLATPLSPTAVKALLACRSEVDEFHAHGREVYWLCRVKQSESPFFKIGFERLLKVPVTVRGINTIRNLAAKYGFAGAAV